MSNQRLNIFMHIWTAALTEYQNGTRKVFEVILNVLVPEGLLWVLKCNHLWGLQRTIQIWEKNPENGSLHENVLLMPEFRGDWHSSNLGAVPVFPHASIFSVQRSFGYFVSSIKDRRWTSLFWMYGMYTPLKLTHYCWFTGKMLAGTLLYVKKKRQKQTNNEVMPNEPNCSD